MQTPTPADRTGRPSRRQIIAALAAAPLLGTGARPAFAQAAYPAGAIKAVVPSTPGVLPDIWARAVAQKLAENWKVPVVVENRAGAGGTIGAGIVAKAPADGYTLLFADSGVWGVSPHMYAKPGYDPLKDLVPVIQLAMGIAYIAVNASFPARTIQEFVAYAKANPGKVKFASPGVGSTSHLLGEMMARQTGIQITHIPYKGVEAVRGVVANEVDFTIFSVAAIDAFVKDGRMRALATTNPQRSAVYPDVPTLKETVAPDYDVTPNFGVLVPAGTPPAVVAKLNAGITAVLTDPTFTPNFFKFGLAPVADATPARFAAAIQSEYTNFGKVIKELGIKPE